MGFTKQPDQTKSVTRKETQKSRKSFSIVYIGKKKSKTKRISTKKNVKLLYCQKPR